MKEENKKIAICGFIQSGKSMLFDSIFIGRTEESEVFPKNGVRTKYSEAIGATILDCPGIGLSKSRNSEVYEILKTSDIILFLFKSNVAISDGQICILRKIKDIMPSNKDLFILRNTPDAVPESSEEELYEYDLEYLKRHGFENPKLFTVNIFQYYWGRIGERYLNGDLLNTDMYKFIELYKPYMRTGFEYDFSHLGSAFERVWKRRISWMYDELDLNSEITDELIGDSLVPVVLRTIEKSLHYNSHNNINNKTMDKEVYLEKKGQLLDLIHNGVKLSGISDFSRNLLNNMADNLNKDAFYIAIQGHFQHGKSTLFNSLFNGRDTNPTGKGIKTSAGIVYGVPKQNDEKDWTEVILLTQEDLKFEFFQILRKHLSCDKLKRIGISESTDINLFDEMYVKLLQSAMVEEWKNILTLPVGSDERIRRENFGRILDIRLNFFNSNDVKSLYAQADDYYKFTLDLAHAKNLMKFPSDWESYWADAVSNWNKSSLLSSNISHDSVLFAFIDKIFVHAESKYLESVGATIVDCPGYGDSEWDDKLADNALETSNAVIYVVRADEALDDKCAKSLNEIRNRNSIKGKLFILRNTSNANPKAAHEEFYLHDVAYLKRMGFEDPRYYTVNILQYYLAKIGKSYLKKKVSNAEIDSFIKNYKPTPKRSVRPESKNTNVDNTFETVWKKRVALYFDDAELDSETIDALEESSGMKSVLDSMERFLIENKAETLLYDSGADEVLRILEERESECKQIMRDADLANQSFQDELQKVRSQTAEYVTDSKVKVKETLTTYPKSTYIARNFCENEIFCESFKQIAANEIAQIIYDKVLSLKGVNKALFKSKEFEKTIEDIVSSYMNSEIGRKLNLWQTQMIHGSDYSYKKEVDELVNQLRLCLISNWKLEQNNNSSLKSFNPDFPPVHLDEINKSFCLNGDNFSGLDNVRGNAISGVAGAVGSVILGVALFIAGALSILITGSVLLYFVSLPVAFFAAFFAKDKTEEWSVKAISKKIKKSIDDAFANSEKRSSIIDNLSQIPADNINRHKQMFDLSLDNLNRKAESSILQRELNNSGSIEERIARKNNALIEIQDELEPLIADVKKFIDNK